MDGVIDPCWENGYLPGAQIWATCAPGCMSLDFSSCGDVISTWADVEAAIAEAAGETTPQVVSLPGGTYTQTTKINLADSNGGGLTVRAAPGEVVEIVGASTAPAFDAVSPEMAVEGLLFHEVAFPIKADTGAARMRIAGNQFRSTAATTSTRQIQILADDVVVDGNRFTASGASVDAGIEATNVVGLIVRGNIMFVDYREANWFSGASVVFDHNTVQNDNSTQGHPLRLDGTDICARNNVLSNVGSNSWAVVSPDQGSSATEGCVPATSNNLVYRSAGAATVCYAATGTECDDICGPGGDMLLCDLYGAPEGDSATGCPTPGGNLDGTGIEVGYDMTPTEEGNFNGAAPEVGARERLGTRTYGGDTTTCN